MVYASVEDIRLAAKRRLPRIFFDYIDGGSFAEKTLADNTGDFDRWQLEQRVLVDVSARDLSTTILGRQISLPLVLAPVGFSGLFAPRGEILAARAAHASGIPFCLSNFGITSLENIRKATSGPIWFQLYVLKDKDLAEHFVRRAEHAAVDALCFTVDLPTGGVRERDVRNGFRYLSNVTPSLALSLMTRPRWCIDVARHGIPTIEHLADRPEFGRNVLEQAVNLGKQVDSSLNWDVLRRLRDRWKRKLVLKGVLHVADAAMAADIGVDAIIVSNHGGRQLDCAPSSISVLPEIVTAVGSRVEVMIDGGIRRGSHIAKALALGARGVMIGRPYAYGLGAGGESGVSAVIQLLATELDVTIAHMGLTNVHDLAGRQAEVLRDSGHRLARHVALD